MINITRESVISQEISTLEQQLRYANEVRKKVSEATEELTKAYFGLINAKDEFDKIKKENIEEIRRYKYAISAETRDIEANIKIMSSAVSKERLEQLKAFADVCERLQSLRSAGFFSSVRIDQ